MFENTDTYAIGSAILNEMEGPLEQRTKDALATHKEESVDILLSSIFDLVKETKMDARQRQRFANLLMIADRLRLGEDGHMKDVHTHNNERYAYAGISLGMQSRLSA